MASNPHQHNQLLTLFAAYAKRLDKLYDDFVTRLIATLPLSEDEVWQKLADNPLFLFDDLPYLKARLQHIFDDYVNKQVLCYKAGITDGVALAFSQDKINLGKYTILQDEAIKAARNAAVASFIANRMSRKEGLSLSDKVWNYSQLGKSEVEMGISNVIKDGLKSGTSAEELGRKVRQYLNNPTMMYRRYWVNVATAGGGKKKVARWYRRHIDEKTGKVTFKDEPLERVGTGVYRSARMNGYRLMRTEINMSYHKANASRWANEPFVYGIKVWKSPQHPRPDICDDLEGYYPANFCFTGWHPACMCASAPLTLYGDEKRDFYRRLMKGEDMSNFHSVHEITEANMNPKWKQYIQDQHDSILRAGERGKLAYHLRDNQQYWINQFSKEEQKKMGLLKDDKARIKAIADARHAARTPKQAKDIADRWHEHKRVDALVRKAVDMVAEIKEYPMSGLHTSMAEAAIKTRDAHYLEAWLGNKRLAQKLAYEKSITPDELKWSQFSKLFEAEKDATWMQKMMMDIAKEAQKETSLKGALDKLRDFGEDNIRKRFFDDEVKELKAYKMLLDREEQRMRDWFDYQRYSKNLNMIKDLVEKNADAIGGAFKRLTVSASDFYLQDLEAMRKLVNETYFQPYFNLRGWSDSAAFVAKSKSPIVHQLYDGILNAYRTHGFTADVEEMVDKLHANIDRLKKEAEKAAERKAAKEVSPLMNEKLAKHGEYLGKKDEFTFDRSFFDMLEKKFDVAIPHTNKGSYEHLNGAEIVLDNDKRGLLSLWEKHSVVYHEGGHAIVDQRGLLYMQELADLRNKIIAKWKKQVPYTYIEKKFDWDKGEYVTRKISRRRAYWKDLDARAEEIRQRLRKVDRSYFTKRGITYDDFVEQMCAFRDTISSLFKRNDYGHSVEYFSTKYHRRHEFLAHCFENTFIGNRVFEHFAPEEYKEMIALIRKWQSEIKAGTFVKPPTDITIFRHD